MLNLLFISDNPKIEFIKNELQSILRVIIDVVPDFDRGLKDVFEKRPDTVCIQDQIAGVTGESVARHIRMLLGTGAPAFVLIHDGNGNAKPIKGLFDHVINLNQPEAELAEEIRNTLKVLIGEQWDKIYIPSRQIPASIAPSRVDDEKLVDDFFSDLGTNVFSAPDDAVPGSGPAVEPPHSFIAQPTSDILAEMQRDHAEQTRQTEKSRKTETAPEMPPPPVAVDAPSKPVRVPPAPAQPSLIAPAEFRIKHEKASAGEKVPDDPIRSFGENHPEPDAMKRAVPYVIVLLFLVAAGCWWYLKQKPAAPVPSKQQEIPVAAPAPAPVPAPVEKTTAAPALPVFIPRDGHDPSFAADHPGWERYVSKQIEFRVFSAGDKLKAVQILATSGAVISEALVKAVLTELAGSADYRIDSRKRKAGMLVLRGSIPRKADVILYKKGSTVRAIVVSPY